jgi:hypothetical protein
MTLSQELITDRLAQIGPLAKGAHESDGIACIMEAVAAVAGEKWSDHPECACPVISAFLRSWNDDLPDDMRDELLRPLIPHLIGTRGTKDLERRRSLMAADWLVRICAPTWLRLAGLREQADRLAALSEITAMDQVPSIRSAIKIARDAAWDASWAAAGAAAGAAAMDAAWAAARAAAMDAAGDAASAALASTCAELQQSALALVNRMIAAKD